MVRILSDKELAAQIKRARRAGEEADRTEPRAVSAKYNPETRRIELELRDGCSFAFPVDVTQGLRGASDEELAEVEVLGRGSDLRWERLDADFTVPGLLMGRLGSARWMAEVLGRAGGSAKSAAKTRAARANGRKGGRPRSAKSAAKRTGKR
jgi:hypothetical protein